MKRTIVFLALIMTLLTGCETKSEDLITGLTYVGMVDRGSQGDMLIFTDDSDELLEFYVGSIDSYPPLSVGEKYDVKTVSTALELGEKVKYIVKNE